MQDSRQVLMQSKKSEEKKKRKVLTEEKHGNSQSFRGKEKEWERAGMTGPRSIARSRYVDNQKTKRTSGGKKPGKRGEGKLPLVFSSGKKRRGS